MSGLAMAGHACALGAFFSMMFGAMFLFAPCGVAAIILGSIGIGIGGALWRTEPQRAKAILAMSVTALVTTLIIVVMMLIFFKVI